MPSIDNREYIPVMTSIAPFNIDNQRKAVSSWLDVGFKVMSYNCREEIEKLSPFFKDVEFVEAYRDARKDFGKPYVYFHDIMNFFKNSSYDICGIINSDIHLRGVNKKLIEFIKNEAKDSLVFGQRIDIDSLDDLSGNMYIGFDYFFFDRSIAVLYPEEKFCIGQPVWDYWIIFIAVINNIRTKRLTNHIAYHIKHKQNWSEEINSSLTDVVLGKYMNFLGEYNLRREGLYREYKRYVFHKNEDIYFSTDEKEKSILVVYNENRLKDNISSETYRSIANQQYSNYRIVKGTLESVDISNIKEEMVCYIDEGYIVESHFLKIMSESIKAANFAVCGVKITYPETMSIDFVYPHNKMENLAYADILHSCIIFKTDFLRSCEINGNINMSEACFIGQGIVELLSNRVKLLYEEGRYEQIVEAYSNHNMSEILYYVALAHKKLGNSEKVNISILNLLQMSEYHNLGTRSINFQCSFEGIADMILGNGCEIEPYIWQRLYSFCISRADIRYKLLSALYMKKMYDRILEFEAVDSEEVYFYVGRAYKDMMKYDMAEHYLKKYLNGVKALEKLRLKPVLAGNYRISAYFHLGEMYYACNDFNKAKEYFLLCTSLLHIPHKKAQEYLARISDIEEGVTGGNRN